MNRRLSYKDLSKLEIEIIIHTEDDQLNIFEYPYDEDKILAFIGSNQTNISFVSFVLIDMIHAMKFDRKTEDDLIYWIHDTSYIHTQIYEYINQLYSKTYKYDKQIQLTNKIYREYISNNQIKLSQEEFINMFISGNFIVLNNPILTNEKIHDLLIKHLTT